MPCDAACIKIIINTGFMAALAPHLDGPAAEGLAAAAGTYNAMLAAMGHTVKNEEQLHGFQGCEQAQALVRWIRGDEPADADKMNRWTAELWSHIADLAAGKLP